MQYFNEFLLLDAEDAPLDTAFGPNAASGFFRSS